MAYCGIEVSPAVLESLKIFNNIVRIGSYELPCERSKYGGGAPNNLQLPKCSVSNFEQFCRWFLEFNDAVFFIKCTRNEALHYLSREIPHIDGELYNNLQVDESCNTMIKIWVELIKNLFQKRIVVEVCCIVMKPYQKGSLLDFLKEFQFRCTMIVLVMVAFQTPLPFFNHMLIAFLINHFPQEVIDCLYDRFPELGDQPICEIISYVRKELIRKFEQEEENSKSVLVTTRASNKVQVSNAFKFSKKKCTCCGKEGHVKKDCRYKNSICDNCKKRGHLKAVCRGQRIVGPRGNTAGMIYTTNKKLKVDFDKDETKRKWLEDGIQWMNKELNKNINTGPSKNQSGENVDQHCNK